MVDINQQIMDGLELILYSKPIHFIYAHSILIGVVSGIISLIPFWVNRMIHLIILLLTLFSSYYSMSYLGISLHELFYCTKTYFIANLVGNYFVGCLLGFVIANAIQKIRGENHATN